MRYFIIFYSGQTFEGATFISNNSITCSTYPSSIELQNRLIARQKCITVVVTGIQELSKEDYDNWISIPNVKDLRK